MVIIPFSTHADRTAGAIAGWQVGHWYQLRGPGRWVMHVRTVGVSPDAADQLRTWRRVYPIVGIVYRVSDNLLVSEEIRSWTFGGEYRRGEATRWDVLAGPFTTAAEAANLA